MGGCSCLGTQCWCTWPLHVSHRHTHTHATVLMSFPGYRQPSDGGRDAELAGGSPSPAAVPAHGPWPPQDNIAGVQECAKLEV